MFAQKWYRERDKYTHLNFVGEITHSSADDDNKNYYHIDERLFNKLLGMVEMHVLRKNTVMKVCL